MSWLGETRIVQKLEDRVLQVVKHVKPIFHMESPNQMFVCFVCFVVSIIPCRIFTRCSSFLPGDLEQPVISIEILFRP